MLSGPRALASASETSDYLLHEYLVRNDKAHRTANRWHGGGAEALGLPERVSRRRFDAVLEGHVPGTDIRLGRVVDGKHQHRPGWDCTFSAPKSVSLEALLHDNKAVMRAHDASVRAALDWIEAEFLQTRGYDPATGRRPRVKADGLVAATFQHVASRNNDPQLHTHAVIANMTRNAAGEWRSVEPTLLRRNRRLIGAWYRNDLARRLGEMGYVLVPTVVGGLPSFELAGYSPAMLEAFSTRRRDILDYMADRGWKYDAKTAQAATLQRFAPEMEKRLRRQWRRPQSRSWRVDETYIKVRGKWAYLYRAVDKLGNTIDFYLSATRNTKEAKRFLGKALRGLKEWEQPEVLNTDKAPAYAAAIAELKAEGKCPKDTRHRQVKYLNNVIEADHGKLKLPIRPVRGFKTMKTAYATIKGFEVMRALRKGQAGMFALQGGIVGEARIVERAFDLGPCALTEAVALLQDRLASAET